MEFSIIYKKSGDADFSASLEQNATRARISLYWFVIKKKTLDELIKLIKTKKNEPDKNS